MGNNKGNLNEKRKRLIAIDQGFHKNKVAYYDEYGTLQLDRIISSIAHLPEKPVDFSDDDVFSLNGEWYCVGPTALSCPKELILPLETFEDLKATYAPWLSYIVNKYGNGFDSFDHVILGLSLAYSDRADELLEHLYSTLSIDSDTNYFIVTGQSYASKICYKLFNLNPLQPAKRGQVKMENYLIIDIGGFTIDCTLVLGSSSSAALKLGFEKTGVINCAYSLIDTIYQKYGFQIGLRQAQLIVDEGKGILTRRGREIDLSDDVLKIKKQYITNVLNLIEEKLGSSIDSNIEGILLIGGGANLIKDLLDDPEVTEEISKHFSLNFIRIPEAPDYYNVISYMKLGERLIEEGKI